jgi:diadenosine tetraphosphate (Ap4A) HIT family hydrolase
MTFQELKHFITTKMRMSHIYQPLMIKTLLRKNGMASDKEIAKQLLQFDPSQIEYYQSIVKKMVGKILRSHRIVEKTNDNFFLVGFTKLSRSEIDELSALCDSKVDDYIKKRGDRIWEHRKVNRNIISGSIRYEVLKRAHFRCELCGIPADEMALEVDHIIPIFQKGKDDISNFQALCYRCNANKGNRDNTDFRSQGDIFLERDKECLFCNIKSGRIIQENNLAFLIEDKYPVTAGHCLIIPKRHFQSYFDITQPEINSVHHLVNFEKRRLLQKDKNIKGFNIGINSGVVAGQTIFHTHIHLIPRREKDVEVPTGGVRNIICNS